MSNYLDIDYLKAHAKKAHAFGLGFFQVKLDDATRVHVWHPGFKRHREEIHNHKNKFRSTILKGAMVQHVYDFQRAEWGEYEMYETDCLANREQPKAICRLDLLNHQEINIGVGLPADKYEIDEHVFHRIEADMCVTVFVREPATKELAQVVRKVGATSICPLSETMSEADVWAHIAEVLAA